MFGATRTIASLGLILGVGLAAGAAELPFSTMQPVASLYNAPSGLAVVDINGDGASDVVTCSPLEGTVRVYFQTASGMTTRTDIAVGLDSPYALDVGDVDNDGDIDVLVGQNINSSQAELTWIANPLHGGGPWAVHDVENLTSGFVVDPRLVDLDRDGDLDIVYATSTTGPDGIKVAWNDGTPVGDPFWATSVVWAVGTAPISLALGDLDGDGDEDIAAAFFSGDVVAWYENPGTPAGSWAVETINSSLDGPSSVATGDFDGDGMIDVAVAASFGDSVVWYENNGSWSGHVVASWDGPNTVFSTDLDRDGDDDLLATSQNTSEVAWIENKGASGWTRHQIESSFHQPLAAAVGDFDGDGDRDVVAVSHTDDLVGWWRNETIHRRAATSGASSIQTGLDNPQGVAAGDLNGDGLTDIVYAERGGDRIGAAIGVSTTGYVWGDIDVATTGVDGARDVFIADINGDGAPDVVSASVDQGEVAWWENDGAGFPSWTKHVVMGLGGAHAVVAADFDLDGDLDIAAAGRSADTVQWLSNADGVGTSWNVPSNHVIASVDGPYELAVGDLNRDGFPDLAMTGYEGDTVRVYLRNQAMGRFDEHIVAIMLDAPRGIDLADLDGDGDLDLVATLSGLNQVRWWQNDGTGEIWLSNNLYSGFASGAGISTADIDGDGDIDVFGTSQSDDDVAVWINRGDGSSWIQTFWETNLDTPWSVVAAPVDSDGDLDLVVTAAGGADVVQWYSNTGGQFGADIIAQHPGSASDGARIPIAYIGMNHYGREDHDPSLELAGLTLSFTDGAGTPLTSSLVNDVVENLEVYRDEGGVSFDPGEDSLFFTDSYLSLTSGLLTTMLPDGALDAQVLPARYQGFWIVIQATSDASDQSLSAIIVEADEALVRAEDRDHDLPLVGEAGVVETTGVIEFAMFADGFESGGTGRWDSVAP